MFLIEKFHQFHAEVVRLRTNIADATWAFDRAAATGTAAAAADASPSAVWRRLLAVLERQELDAGREGGDFGAEIYRRAQYAMAVLADEIFLNFEWPGREAWRHNLLESKLFGSHRAGEELFERIEQILRDRDNMYTELARVYLMVLALGFQGKYRGEPDADVAIEAYRRRLFRFIFSRDPLAVRGSEPVMPQAYAATLDEGRGQQLAYLRPWIWAMVLVVALWLAGSHWLWKSATAEIEPLMEEISNAAAHSGGGR